MSIYILATSKVISVHIHSYLIPLRIKRPFFCCLSVNRWTTKKTEVDMRLENPIRARPNPIRAEHSAVPASLQKTLPDRQSPPPQPLSLMPLSDCVTYQQIYNVTLLEDRSRYSTLCYPRI